jgi:hypothetical protein
MLRPPPDDEVFEPDDEPLDIDGPLGLEPEVGAEAPLEPVRLDSVVFPVGEDDEPDEPAEPMLNDPELDGLPADPDECEMLTEPALVLPPADWVVAPAEAVELEVRSGVEEPVPEPGLVSEPPASAAEPPFW